MENEVAEVEQQVLPMALDSPEPVPVDSPEPRRTSPSTVRPHSQLLPAYCRFDAPCGAQDRVALCHAQCIADGRWRRNGGRPAPAPLYR